MKKQLGFFLLIMFCKIDGMLAMFEDDFNDSISSRRPLISPFQYIFDETLQINNLQRLSNQGNVIVHVHAGAKLVINNHQKKPIQRKKGKSSPLEGEALLASLIATSHFRRTPQENPQFTVTGRRVSLLHRTTVKGPTG